MSKRTRVGGIDLSQTGPMESACESPIARGGERSPQHFRADLDVFSVTVLRNARGKWSSAVYVGDAAYEEIDEATSVNVLKWESATAAAEAYILDRLKRTLEAVGGVQVLKLTCPCFERKEKSDG